ncbi:MAG: FAD-dependent monooxygenase [Chloroflexota bacterium]|nr:FAD-dependent monooxygenase [Chloroflexota bacterium]MDQ5864472.1 FAD-dependent monooxygenase [Chloroflexota bacterium]
MTPKSKTQNPKSITVLGAGPAGLYFALLAKKANPSCDITVIERNPADVTYGWGVVFSDRTLASFQRADYKTYERITENFVIWDAIDVRYRGETIRCGGHVIAAISRRLLLNILQERCAELGVNMVFGREVHDLAELDDDYDLLVAADGIHSLARKQYEADFKPSIEMGRARYIWLGAERVLDAFTFIFHETEHGLFQVHAYPYSGTSSTFIVECTEDTWQRAGLDHATEEESLAFCQRLLDNDLNGARLLSNNSKWISFPTLKTRNWHTKIQNPKSKIQNLVLMGDAAHTAHFSIGSGTKLAMEDAIALANALEQHLDVEKALNEYELERKPVVETFQRAAHESQTYFETLKRYLVLDPVPFAFQLLTRSGRITYDDLHFRDAQFGDMVDRWMYGRGRTTVAPPPMFAPFQLRTMCLRNRAVVSPMSGGAEDGAPNEDYVTQLAGCAEGGAGLVLTDMCAVSPEGRVTPSDLGMYSEAQGRAWASAVERVRVIPGACIGVRLGYAGRRGSTRPRSEGLDRPLKEGGWPLIAASAIPYTLSGQVPKEMDRADMDRVRDDFVRSARMAHEAGFDLLQLDFAHGYLLAGFLSPLTNRRTDEYGGSLEHRARYPLEVLDAVRAVWPENKPLSVALTATDYVKGGLEVEDAIEIARLLKAHGCDLVHVHAGQTTPEAEPPYAKGFLTPLSDRIRNEAGVPTMVGGYLTTSNEANTVLAAGKADLCVMERQQAG